MIVQSTFLFEQFDVSTKCKAYLNNFFCSPKKRFVRILTVLLSVGLNAMEKWEHLLTWIFIATLNPPPCMISQNLPKNNLFFISGLYEVVHSSGIWFFDQDLGAKTFGKMRPK